MFSQNVIHYFVVYFSQEDFSSEPCKKLMDRGSVYVQTASRVSHKVEIFSNVDPTLHNAASSREIPDPHDSYIGSSKENP